MTSAYSTFGVMTQSANVKPRTRSEIVLMISDKMVTIDLSKHTSSGARIFIGEDRARAICDCYDTSGEVTVVVPDDILSLSNSFVREFNDLCPDLTWVCSDHIAKRIYR